MKPIRDRSDEELNRTIAVFMGYEYMENIQGTCGFYRLKDDNDWGTVIADPSLPLCRDGMRFVPNFASDLNACHEAEGKILEDADTGYAYDCELNEVCGVFDDGILNFMKMWHATARQRAEALVAVIEQQKGDGRD